MINGRTGVIAAIFIVACVGIYFGWKDSWASAYLASDNIPPPPRSPIAEDLFEDRKSAIGTEEDPAARQRYFFEMLKNPETGSIPPGIRAKEIEYANTLPQQGGPYTHAFRTQLTNWESLGPFNIGGRTRAVAIDVSNEKIFMAGGVSGGMWRSENEGIKWELVTTPENLHSVTCVAQDTRNGKTGTWYYGTGEIQGNSARAPFAPYRGDGIFKSEDGGLTWDLLPSTNTGEVEKFNSQFQYVWNIATNPFNTAQDEVLAAIIGAIVRSTDGGATWDYVLGNEFANGPGLDLNEERAARFSDVRITTDGTYYAALSSDALDRSDPNAGIYRSVDGVNWTEITPFRWPSEFSRVVIAPAPSNPDIVYFVGNAEEEDQLWRYTFRFGNGSGLGGNWEDLTQNIPDFGGDLGDFDTQNSYNMMLKVHPTNEDIVYLGGTNLFRTMDGFRSDAATDWIGGYDTANNFNIYANHYVDQHDIVFFPSNPNRMLSANDGGVFLNANNIDEKISWVPLNNGFVTSQYYTVGFDDQTSDGIIIGGLQDNGTQIANDPFANTQWTRFLGGDGAFSTVTRGQKYVYASFQESQIYRFTVNDKLEKTSFARVDPVGGGEKEDQGYLFVNPFVLDPNNQNIMYLAGGDIIWVNDNLTQIPGGSQQKTSVNWQNIPSSRISQGQVSALAASTFPAHILYYGTSTGKLLRISKANQDEPTVQDITPGNFPQNGYINCIAINKNNAEEIMVVFANYGVPSLFYSDNGGASYQDVSGNLEENPDGSGNGPSVRWAEIVPVSQGNRSYFVATSTGVYSTSELQGPQTVWVNEAPETIGNVVSVMVKHRSEDGALLAATHGRGLFKAQIADVAQPDLAQNPEAFEIDAPYPNPFDQNTKITFDLPEDGIVRVKILSLTGQEITTLMWGHMYAGTNQVTWDGTNPTGLSVPGGIYLCQIEYKNTITAKKLYYRN